MGSNGLIIVDVQKVFFWCILTYLKLKKMFYFRYLQKIKWITKKYKNAKILHNPFTPSLANYNPVYPYKTKKIIHFYERCVYESVNDKKPILSLKSKSYWKQNLSSQMLIKGFYSTLNRSICVYFIVTGVIASDSTTLQRYYVLCLCFTRLKHRF